MNMFIKVVIFMVMFNIASFLVSATGFFPYTLYGDATHYAGLSEPGALLTPEGMFNQIILNAGEPMKIAGVEIGINWGVLMGSIITIAIVAGAITHSSIPITLGLLASMFLFMYINSKTTFDQMLGHLDQTAQYLGLMIGLMMLIILVVVIMDYAAGQKNV